MKFHRFANYFPMMTEPELNDLAKNIKERGQDEKILTYKGEIADGRNRFLACQRAKVKPQFKEFRGTEKQLLDKIESLNLFRRHLNESQRALAAAEFLEASKAVGAPVTKADVARKFNTSEPTLKRAGRVARKGGAKLKAMVMKGEATITKAAALVDSIAKRKTGNRVLQKSKSIERARKKRGAKVGGPPRGGLAVGPARAKRQTGQPPR